MKYCCFLLIIWFLGISGGFAQDKVECWGKRLRDSILSPFFHSYIFAIYKNEALWI